MERIQLSRSCKNILRAIRDKKYGDIPRNDTEDLLFLEHKGLINVEWCEFGYAVVVNLSNMGHAYMRSNPKLRNPSIFEDGKYWISTIISIIALLVSLFDDYLKNLFDLWIK